MEEHASAVGPGPSPAAAKSWVVPSLEALAALPQLHALPAEPHPAADPYELFCFITAARRCLLAPGAPPPPAALLALLAREAGSLRSAMARGALTCACELGEHWRAGVAFPAAAALVGALVARCANSADKRFIRDLALLALQRCALAQPCSEMLLHLLSLEAVGRNRAAALVVATVADALLRALPDASIDALDLAAALQGLAAFFSCRCATARSLAVSMLATLCSHRGFAVVHAAVLRSAHGRPSLLTDMLRGLAVAAPLDMQGLAEEQQAAAAGLGAGAVAAAGAAEEKVAVPLGSPGGVAGAAGSTVPAAQAAAAAATPAWGGKLCFREALRELRAMSARRTAVRVPKAERAGGVGGSGSSSSSSSSSSSKGSCRGGAQWEGGEGAAAQQPAAAAPDPFFNGVALAPPPAAALSPSQQAAAGAPGEENSAEGCCAAVGGGGGGGGGSGLGASGGPPLAAIRSPAPGLDALSPFSAHRPRSSLGFGRKSLTPNSVGLRGALSFRSSLGGTAARSARALQPLPLFLAALSQAAGAGGQGEEAGAGARPAGSSSLSPCRASAPLDHHIFLGRSLCREGLEEGGSRAHSAPTSLS